MPPSPRLFTRRHFLQASAATLAGLSLYADTVGRHELEITNRTIFLRNLPAPFDGYRILQFSDLHLEEFTEDFFLRRVIAAVNSIPADLVLVTGDFISRGPFPYSYSLAAAARCAQLLATLTHPLRFGILGNHDAAVGSAIVRRHMENHGLPLLVNQFVPIEKGNSRIILAGIDDFSVGTPNLTAAIPANPGCPVILMAHEPDFATRLFTHPRGPLVPLMLSGHTHGGQVRIPGLPPLALPPLGRLYIEGLYHLGPTQLYVNRGIGTVGVPFRLNCPPEITILTLRPTDT